LSAAYVSVLRHRMQEKSKAFYDMEMFLLAYRTQ